MAKSLGLTVAAAATLLMVSSASATEGYFSHGNGVRQSAMAGAGVADATDAMAISLNPAGITQGGDQFSVAAIVFSPRRGFSVTDGPGFLPSGDTDSDSEFFVMPNLGLVRQIDDRSAFSIAMWGNGGMNTDYSSVTNPNCGPSSGIFCAGSAGVDFMQMFVSVGYARNITDGLTLGIAPVFAYQMFEAKGLAAFQGLSADPANMTNNEHDAATGWGYRVGAEFRLTDGFAVGASYQSEIGMSEFGDYAGLFEGQGSFDIPASFQIGFTAGVMDNITVSVDYRHISYGEVAAIGNSTTTPAPFGSSGGPGFGWEDVDAVKVGVEFQATDQMMIRAGFGLNNNPIGPEDVTLNVLAPGVQEMHLTTGFSYQANDVSAFDFSLMYSPESTVSGPEMTPGGPTGRRVELNMHQFSIGFGWTYTLGQ